MEMDPLGAIRLRDERNKSGFAAFTQGLDDYGNMDTARKEKNVWERYLGEQNKENAEEADDPYAASKRMWEVHRDIANIHRNAKLRGLNYDQSIIDEQTAKPERDRQHELALKKFDNDELLRQMGYQQEDIDNARKIYDNAVDKARTEQGRINALRREIQEQKNRGLTPDKGLELELSDAQSRILRYVDEGTQAKEHLEGLKGKGHKPSQFIMSKGTDKPPTEAPPGEATNTEATEGKTAFDFFPQLKEWSQTHLNEDKNALDQFFKTLNIDSSQQQALRGMYTNQVAFNKAEAERKFQDQMREAQLASARAQKAKAKNEENWSKGLESSMQEFLKGDTKYSLANSKKLAVLISDYNAKNPQNIIQLGIDKLTGASEAEYNQQLDILKKSLNVPEETIERAKL